jgi:hypothetical protein
MQKLSLNDDEKISRKDYLKSKKKNKFTKKSKITYIVVGLFTILAIYVFVQFYIYSKNSLSYEENELIKRQPVYDIYYISEGYTYEPKYSLNTMKSSGFEQDIIYKDLGFINILNTKEYIYGIESGKIVRMKKSDKVLETVYEDKVLKYTIYNSDLYAVVAGKIVHIDLNTLEKRDFFAGDITEVLVDENYVYLCIDERSKKILVRFDKSGANKVDLVNNHNVSYIIQNETNIFFVNKADGNKIYTVKKDNSGISKVADICSVTDTGVISEIDGSKYMFFKNNSLYYVNTSDNRNLWVYNFDKNTNEKVLHMSLELLEIEDNTVFYKVKDENGVYLYNLETKLNSLVSKRLIKEFIVSK